MITECSIIVFMRHKASSVVSWTVRLRFRLACTALALAGLTLSFPQAGYCASKAGPRLVTLSLDGKPQEGLLAVPGSVDYYEFTVAQLSWAAIYTTGALDSTVEIHSLQHGLVAKDDDGGEGTNFRIARMLLPDVYYLRVGAFDAGSYTLHVDVRPASPVELDPEGRPQTGVIDTAESDDYFRLKVERLSRADIYSTGGLDVAGMLFNSQGQPLGGDDDSGPETNFRIQAPALPAGEYYLRVNGKSGVTGSYDLYARVQPMPLPTLSLGGAPKASAIRVEGIPDYFRFSLARPSQVVAYTTGGLDSGGVVYTPGLSAVVHDDNSGEGSNFRIDQTLFPGDYYVAVHGLSGTGSYNLHTTVAPVPARGLPLDGSPLVGGLADEGEHDYFRFSLEKLGRVAIYTTGKLNRTVKLLDSQGKELRSRSHQGENASTKRSTLVDQLLLPGDYYVSVEGSSSSETGEYSLHSEMTPVSPTTLSLNGNPQQGELENGLDRKYYRFTATEGAAATFYTSGDVDTAAILHNPNGDRIAASDDGGPGFINFYVTTALLLRGDYVLEVVSSSGSGGNYTLHVESTPLGRKQR